MRNLFQIQEKDISYYNHYQFLPYSIRRCFKARLTCIALIIKLGSVPALPKNWKVVGSGNFNPSNCAVFKLSSGVDFRASKWEAAFRFSSWAAFLSSSIEGHLRLSNVFKSDGVTAADFGDERLRALRPGRRLLRLNGSEGGTLYFSQQFWSFWNEVPVTGIQE